MTTFYYHLKSTLRFSYSIHLHAKHSVELRNGIKCVYYSQTRTQHYITNEKNKYDQRRYTSSTEKNKEQQFSESRHRKEKSYYKSQEKLEYSAALSTRNDKEGNLRRQQSSKFNKMSDVADAKTMFGTLSNENKVVPGTHYYSFKDKYKKFEDDEDSVDDYHRPLIKVGRYSSNEYSKKIREYGKKGMIQEAIVVIEKWMMENERIRPTVKNINALLHELGRVGYTKKAFQVFTMMRRHNIEPNKYTYASLFNACANSPYPETDGAERAFKLWCLLQSKDIHLDVENYHVMIKAFAAGKDYEMVYLLTDIALKKFLYTGTAHLPTLLSLLLKASATDTKNGFQHALAAWRNFSKLKDFKPDAYNYNQLLTVVRNGGVQSEKELLNMLYETCSLPPEEVFAIKEKISLQNKDMIDSDRNPLNIQATENTLCLEQNIDSTEKIDRTDLIVELEMNPKLPKTKEENNNQLQWWEVAQMEQGGKQNAASLKSINLDCLASESHDSIEESFPDLLNPSEILSDVVAISSMKTRQDRINLLGGVKGFLIRMEEDEIVPYIGIFGQLLDLTPENVEAESSLIQYMTDKKVKPDIEFFNKLVWRRTERKCHRDAKAVIALITNHGLIPNIITYNSLGATVQNYPDALQLLKDIQSSGLDPTIETYKVIIFRCGHRGVKKLLQKMNEDQVLVDNKFIRMIESYKDNCYQQLEEKDENYAGLFPITQEECEIFEEFYHKWLQTVHYREEVHPWEDFRLTGPKEKNEEKIKRIDP